MGADRLDKVVSCPLFHRRNRRINTVDSRQEDNRTRFTAGGEPGLHIQTVQLRHLQIEQEAAVAFGIVPVQELDRGGKGRDPVTSGGEKSPQGTQETIVVINDKDPGFLKCVWRHLPPSQKLWKTT